ncbi:MAG: PQQ-binding-like beta-propeller repeat protein [Candidatus Brocadiia bacterium]
MNLFLRINITLCTFAALSINALVANVYAEDQPRAHIRVNAEATATLSQAGQAADAANWVQAAVLYQKALEQYGDYVVPAETKDSAGLYRGARYAALQGLRDMPSAGRKAYQSMFDQPARTLFQAAQSAGPNGIKQLAEITERYLFSSSGPRALAILSADCLEQSDITGAEHYLDQAVWLYGQGPYPDALRSNMELLAKLKAPVAQSESAGNDWPAYCGNSGRNLPARGKLPLAQMPPLAGVFPDNTDPGRLLPPAPNPNVYNPYYRPQNYDPNAYLPYFPVVKRERIFLATGSAVYAFGIPKPPQPVSPAATAAAGLPNRLNPLPALWKFEIPRDDAVRFFFENRVICTAAAAGDRVYAPMITAYAGHETQLGFLDVKFPFPNRTLFCFNATNGKIIWSSEKLAKVSFSVAPAVENDSLYAGGVKAPQQTDLPEHYVYCLDAATGALKWQTFIASGMLETNLFNNPSREPVSSPVTIAGDTVYYCANIGVVAALDKYNGAVKWISYYQQYNIPPVRQDYTPVQLPLNWINNPVLSHNGCVYAAPIDSPYLLCLSEADGRPLWRWDGEEIGGTRYILGARENQLVISGSSAAASLNVEKQGKPEWVIANHPFRGKGLIADGLVYLPTLNGLLEVGLKNGTILNLAQWSNPQECGNLVLTPGLCLSASAGRLSAYLPGQAALPMTAPVPVPTKPELK